MALPAFTMSELLGAGVHFGHRNFRWNPRLKSYIFGTRNGIHVIDLQQTVPLLYTALAAVEATTARGGRVLFVGTRPNAQQIIKEAALSCGQYYINHRWLGGLLTNWKTVGQSIKRLRELQEQFAASEAVQAQIAELKAKATPENPVDLSGIKDPMSHLTKKERLMRTRERANLDRVLGGIMTMAGLPDLVVVLSVKEDKIAVDEATRLGIPVIGIVDTNADSEGVTYVVPGNDDSSRALSLYTRLFAESVKSGTALHQQMAAAQPQAAEGSTRAPRSKAQTTVSLSKAAQAVVAADAAAEAAVPAQA
ncbi:MAG: 30S ribosomal protein S2 [Pseudomonadota bacterium]